MDFVRFKGFKVNKQLDLKGLVNKQLDLKSLVNKQLDLKG